MKKLLILAALTIATAASAQTYRMESAIAQTCFAVAGVAVNVVEGKKAGMSWDDITDLFKNVKSGTYRNVLVSTTKQAYDNDSEMPAHMLRQFSYDHCASMVRDYAR